MFDKHTTHVLTGLKPDYTWVQMCANKHVHVSHAPRHIHVYIVGESYGCKSSRGCQPTNIYN